MRVDRDRDNSPQVVAHERLFNTVESFLPRGWSGKLVVTVEAGRATEFTTVREAIAIRAQEN